MIRLIQAAVLATFLVPDLADAQVQCAEHKALAMHLRQRFSEVLTASGVDGRGRPTELYRSESGTWTFVVIPTEGQACILSAGRDWAAKALPEWTRKGRKI